mmetsp:Transcript_101092/g.140462  ORF Transcript_101092/g.140462 Transcript_101092/m.140462 type:complete len:280 (-) Transcript_101092:36-875(-)
MERALSHFLTLSNLGRGNILVAGNASDDLDGGGTRVGETAQVVVLGDQVVEAFAGFQTTEEALVGGGHISIAVKGARATDGNVVFIITFGTSFAVTSSIAGGDNFLVLDGGGGARPANGSDGSSGASGATRSGKTTSTSSSRLAISTSGSSITTGTLRSTVTISTIGTLSSGTTGALVSARSGKTSQTTRTSGSITSGRSSRSIRALGTRGSGRSTRTSGTTSSTNTVGTLLRCAQLGVGRQVLDGRERCLDQHNTLVVIGLHGRQSHSNCHEGEDCNN